MDEDRIEIEVETGWETLPSAADLVERAGLASFETLASLAPQDDEPRESPRHGEEGRAADRLEPRTVTILLTDDATLADLNGRFRAKPYPTNVLSFPAPANPERHLGDIALAYETCAREAAEQGKPLSDHLQHLVAHGVLHLVGYDHESEADALVMEERERQILALLGLPDPYVAREDAPR